MKIKNSRNNIAVLDIGKTHAKVILFDAIELEELAVFQSNNNILEDSLYPHFDVESLKGFIIKSLSCLLYTSPSPRDLSTSRMPSSA